MQAGHRRRILTAFAAAAMAALLSPLPAAAQTLDELRRSGVVGERFDGLTVVRDTGAPTRIHAMVAKINEQRQKIYSERAAEKGVSADQVGRVYAQEIFQQAPPGTWFLDANGRWIKK